MNLEKLKEIEDALAATSAKGADWWAEDGDVAWELYAENSVDLAPLLDSWEMNDEQKALVREHNPTMRMSSHPLKLIKAPKKSQQYAEYWPDAPDAAFIVKSHNEYVPEMLAALKSLLIRHPGAETPLNGNNIILYPLKGRASLGFWNENLQNYETEDILYAPIEVKFWLDITGLNID